MSESKDLLRVADVAVAIDVTPSRVYQLQRARILPSVRVGGAIRIPRAAWQAWLDRQTDEALEAVVHKETVEEVEK